jgi:Family of unknown function (DUF6130)
MSGPRPTPTRLKLIRGNPGRAGPIPVGLIIIFGLAPGPHKLDITLARANHHSLDHSVVEFVIPNGN